MSRRERIVNEYKNGLLAFDDWFKKLVEITKKKFTGSTYIIVTSDHGQLLGEQGKYGHNHLNLACAKVPFFIYRLNNADESQWW